MSIISYHKHWPFRERYWLKNAGCQLMMETTGEEGKEDGAFDEMICKLLTCVHVLMMRR